MVNTVFILGAGASKKSGAPLMSNFLDEAQDLINLQAISPEETESFKNVFNVIGSLQVVHSKSQLDLINIESIFTIFELGDVIKKLPGLESDQIKSAILDLKKLIVATIEKKMLFPCNANGRLIPSDEYANFIDLIISLKNKANPNHNVSVLTFNYDLGVDVALAVRGIPCNYHLAENEVINNGVDFLKLHGSLNWATTADKRILPINMVSYLERQNHWPNYGSKQLRIEMRNVLKSWFSDKKFDVDEMPLIIPPSWNKSDYHKSISEVWAKAADKLSEADNIFIIGYSLPETDSFFKQLYALGATSNKPLRAIEVFNPSEEVDARFKQLLGLGALPRYKFNGVTFDKAISYLTKQYIRS